jgi:hypothetical protein
MRPGLTSAFQAEVLKPLVFPILLIEFHFNSATKYVWTGYGSISWNAHTWLGIGGEGGIDEISETTDIEMRGMALTRSGIPYLDQNGATIDPITEAQTECKQGNQVVVYFGFFDNGGHALIADPVIAYSGRMDEIVFQLEEDSSTGQMHIEPRRIDINRNNETRYTDSDQRILYSTDRGFEHVAELQDWPGVSGKGKSIPRIPRAFTGSKLDPIGGGLGGGTGL